MNDLEKLCRPLLTCICDYGQYINAGNVPDREEFRNRINMLLAEAKEDAAKSPALEKEFSRIERPLIFFVDYMVKEGGFPFSHEWREMARNYNELSGDEKFFDILAEALDDPDSGKILEVFYTMMGLGFDGIHRNNPEYIERRMKVCASRFSRSKFDVSSEVLTPVDPGILKTAAAKQKSPFKSVRLALVLSAVFMTIAFGINLSAFLKATEDFRQTLFVAAESAIPKTIRSDRADNRRPEASQTLFSENAE